MNGKVTLEKIIQQQRPEQKVKYCLKGRSLHQSNSGFTLIESLVVVLIIGILAAIAAPGWLGFVNARRLTIAQEDIYRAMRTAQGNAKRERITWQASFRETTVNGKSVAQWAVHLTSRTPTSNDWNDLDSNIRIDSTTTNLQNPNGVWQLQFNHKGHRNGAAARITLSPRDSNQQKRCVIASTFLGALRTDKDTGCSASI